MWKITRDLITPEDEIRDGRTWINKSSINWKEEKVKKPDIHKFRLIDGDNIVYLEGISTNPYAFEPLDFFESLLGVVGIEYKNKITDEWELL